MTATTTLDEVTATLLAIRAQLAAGVSYSRTAVATELRKVPTARLRVVESRLRAVLGTTATGRTVVDRLVRLVFAPDTTIRNAA